MSKIISHPSGWPYQRKCKQDFASDVNLVITHVTYNISNILSAYVEHCNYNDETYTWLQSRIDDLVSDFKNRLAVQIPTAHSKRDLFGNIAGLFGSVNSISNTYKITGQSQFSTWLANQVATGFQHISLQ